MKHIMDAPPAAGSIRKDVPPWMDWIIMKCLEKDFGNRYPSAADLASDLRKSHSAKKARMKWLPGGDAIVEDEASNWALVISSSREKPDWSMGMGLRYANRLQEIAAPQRFILS
jgi:hypothetical protein